MADAFSVKIEGMGELRKAFEDLVKALHPDKVEEITLDKAKKLKKAVQSKIKKGPTGKLKKAVKAKLLKRYGSQPAPAITAMDLKKAPHAVNVEYGHVIRRKKGGKVYGRVPPHPFFRPAVDENLENLVKEALNEMGKLIEGAVK